MQMRALHTEAVSGVPQVVHTSPDIYGQIFVPEINNMIMVLAVAVVIGFRDSVHLGNAYGEPPSRPH